MGLGLSATGASSTPREDTAGGGGGSEGARLAPCATTSRPRRCTGGADTVTGHLPMAASGTDRDRGQPPPVATTSRGEGNAGLGREPITEALRRATSRRAGTRRAWRRKSPKVGEAGMAHRAASSAASAAASSTSSATSAHRRPWMESVSITPPHRSP